MSAAADWPDGLSEALKAIRTRPLFVMRLQVLPIVDIGQTPGARRMVGLVPGGTFAGERLSGEVVSAADWQDRRADGVVKLDVRAILETDDGALIAMTYQGLRHGPPEVMARLARGEPVDPADYYFRISPTFETAAPKYDWLNRVLALGTGHREPDGPVYSVFEVL